MITALNLLDGASERHALEVREVVPSGAVEVFDKAFGYAAQPKTLSNTSTALLGSASRNSRA